MNEKVNHPSHYQQDGRKECWDEFIDKFGAETTMLWCILTAYKYLYRKGNKENEAEIKDLKKAENYIKKAKEIYFDYGVYKHTKLLVDASLDVCAEVFKYSEGL